MTFEEIRRALPVPYRMQFDRAVEAETEALIDVRRGTRPRRPLTEAIRQGAREDAQKFFTEDVNEYLGGRVLVPDDALSYRRRTTAWAVARMIMPWPARGMAAESCAKAKDKRHVPDLSEVKITTVDATGLTVAAVECRLCRLIGSMTLDPRDFNWD